MFLETILTTFACEAVKLIPASGAVWSNLNMLVSGAAGNFAHADLQKLYQVFGTWIDGSARPDRNEDLERSIARSAAQADLFCVMEAAGEPLKLPEGKLARWQQLIWDHCPERLKDSLHQNEGFFAEAERDHLQALRHLCEQRLQKVEEAFTAVGIDPRTLISGAQAKPEPLAEARLQELEKEAGYGRLPDRAREFFRCKWFGYACGSFRYEIKHNQPARAIFHTIYLEQIITGVGVLTKWPLLVQTYQSREADGFGRFTYEREMDRFQGRKSELDALLSSFLAPPIPSSARFQFHVLLGDGGVGKSRFALELANRARVNGWTQAGVMYPGMVEKNDWIRGQPREPHFLAIDNAASHGKALVAMLGDLAQRAATLDQPVRILLVDREVQAEFIKQLIPADLNGRAIESFRYSPQPLILPRLAQDNIVELMHGRIRMAGSDPDDFKNLYEQLKAVDPDVTPLFAALVGDALGRGEHSTLQNRCALLEKILDDEQKRWRDKAETIWAGAGKHQLLFYEHLLALATMTRGLDLAWIGCENPSRFARRHLPLIRDFNYNLYEVMCDKHIAHDSLFPMSPDLLGEFFVDRHLNSYPSIREDLVHEAWAADPAGTAFFATLVEADYGTEETDPIRYLPALERVDRQIAAHVTAALRSIAVFYEDKLYIKLPDSALPGRSTVDKNQFVDELRNRFVQSRLKEGDR
jgi:hypothetical protein